MERGLAVFGHDWQSAEGKCIDIRVKPHRDSGTDNRIWLMEVHCGDAEPFRVELGYPGFHEDFKGPEHGQVCRMKCLPGKNEAKWDLDDPGLSWKAERHQKDAQFNAELNAKPWKDQPGS
jgi:hypothetical protein